MRSQKGEQEEKQLRGALDRSLTLHIKNNNNHLNQLLISEDDIFSKSLAYSIHMIESCIMKSLVLFYWKLHKFENN